MSSWAFGCSVFGLDLGFGPTLWEKERIPWLIKFMIAGLLDFSFALEDILSNREERVKK